MSEQIVYTERVGNDHDPNCHACKGLIAHTRHVTIPANYHSEIANLEWRVVEAAVARELAMQRLHKCKSTSAAEITDFNKVASDLDNAVSALIAAREAELKEE